MTQLMALDAPTDLLRTGENRDIIIVKRSDLETEERQLLSRLQQVRRLLGKPPLPTKKQQRLAQAAR